MALMKTPPVQKSWKAEDFSLPDSSGKLWTLQDAKGEKGLVVMFISNHCPYVQAIGDKIAADAKALQAMGVGVIAIGANDTDNYPEDGPQYMREFAREHGFTFPYVFDETQEVARAYDAVCTPDFYGFNAGLELQYRGRLDDSGMERKQGNHRELVEAMRLVAETGKGPGTQYPSMGCSIKWK